MTRNSYGADLLGNLREEFRHLPAGTRIPTIREISGRYSVSHFSVQRAFEALKEEGFIQSFVGRGSFAVGFGGGRESKRPTKQARILIVSHSTPSPRGNEITSLLQGLLQKAGHKLICVSYTDARDLTHVLGAGGFDVCVLQPRRSVLPVEAVALLRAKATHMIVEGRHLELMDVDVLVRNRAKSIAIALRHLHELGHECIGLLTERLDAAAGYAEVENLYTQLYGLSQDRPGFIVRVGINPDGGPAADTIGKALARARLEHATTPSAFVVSGRFAAVDITVGFRRANLEVPMHASVVHLRNAAESTPGDVTFTTVGRSAGHVAKGTFDIVEWRLANPAEPPGLVLDDPSLVKGQTSIPFETG